MDKILMIIYVKINYMKLMIEYFYVNLPSKKWNYIRK